MSDVTRPGKGTQVTVRYHDEFGTFRTIEGIIAGYEFRGTREVLIVSSGKTYRIPERYVATCTIMGVGGGVNGR